MRTPSTRGSAIPDDTLICFLERRIPPRLLGVAKYTPLGRGAYDSLCCGPQRRTVTPNFYQSTCQLRQRNLTVEPDKLTNFVVDRGDASGCRVAAMSLVTDQAPRPGADLVSDQAPGTPDSRIRTLQRPLIAALTEQKRMLLSACDTMRACCSSSVPPLHDTRDSDTSSPKWEHGPFNVPSIRDRMTLNEAAITAPRRHRWRPSGSVVVERQIHPPAA
jgi:hypothetical protein